MTESCVHRPFHTQIPLPSGRHLEEGPPPPRMYEKAGGGGAEEGGGGRFGWDPPSSQGPPMVPAEGGPKSFEASIRLAPKVPKQNFGCQPPTLEGEEGGPGGGTPPPPAVYGRSTTSLRAPRPFCLLGYGRYKDCVAGIQQPPLFPGGGRAAQGVW